MFCNSLVAPWGMTITCSNLLGISTCPVEPLRSMPVLLLKSARTVAAPVVLLITPDTVATLPFSGYISPFASRRVTSGILLMLSVSDLAPLSVRLSMSFSLSEK